MKASFGVVGCNVRKVHVNKRRKMSFCHVLNFSVV